MTPQGTGAMGQKLDSDEALTEPRFFSLKSPKEWRG